MSPELLVSAVLLVALVAYGVLGGADFGAGVWDLVASGPRREGQRDAIKHAMGPVWEANHVWLIFVIVLLFTCYPNAFAVISYELFVPFHVALVGITLRGAAFVFRTPVAEGLKEAWGRIFGVASIVTPVVLGMSLGAVSSGAMRFPSSGAVVWMSPLSWAVGAMALAQCAYLAAVFLCIETEGAVREDFHRRVLWSGTASAALSAVTLLVARFDAEFLWQGLTSGHALPILIAGGVAATLSGFYAWTRRYVAARIAATAQVALILTGWGVAQYPYAIHPDMTLERAMAPTPTLVFVLWTVPFGLVLLLPSLWLLFRVFKGGEGAPDKGH